MIENNKNRLTEVQALKDKSDNLSKQLKELNDLKNNMLTTIETLSAEKIVNYFNLES